MENYEEFPVPSCEWCHSELDIEEESPGELFLCPQCHREKMECEFEDEMERREDVRSFLDQYKYD